MKNSTKIKKITVSAVIASLYIVLTIMSNALGLSNGVIQIRFSEILTVLPILSPSAIGGLFFGCFISNILSGAPLVDVVFGSLATLIGALGTYIFKNKKLLPLLSPVLSNSLIVPFILIYAYSLKGSYFYFFSTVAIGEIISCMILGTILLKTLKKYNIKL